MLINKQEKLDFLNSKGISSGVAKVTEARHFASYSKFYYTGLL
jgi:hypothetical protein